MEQAAATTTTATTSTNTETQDNDFYNTSRVGRRNALPDILDNPCTTVTASDLPDKLSALTTNDPTETNPVKSDSTTNTSSTSDQSSNT